MICCAGRNSEASHSVKTILVSKLNAKILYFWLEKNGTSHSPQMPLRESQRSQQTSMILSSALYKKTEAWYTVTHLPHFLWGHFFKPQQRGVGTHLSSTGTCRKDQQLSTLSRLSYLHNHTSRSLSSHLVSPTDQKRNILILLTHTLLLTSILA